MTINPAYDRCPDHSFGLHETPSNIRHNTFRDISGKPIYPGDSIVYARKGQGYLVKAKISHFKSLSTLVTTEDAEVKLIRVAKI